MTLTIYLTGPKASGKTVVGHALADLFIRLGYGTKSTLNDFIAYEGAGDVLKVVLDADGIGAVAKAMSAFSFDQSSNKTPPLTFGYTNHEGKYAIRQAIPLRVEHRVSPWHGENPQHIMVCFDVEKKAERDFLIEEMQPLGNLKKRFERITAANELNEDLAISMRWAAQPDRLSTDTPSSVWAQTSDTLKERYRDMALAAHDFMTAHFQAAAETSRENSLQQSPVPTPSETAIKHMAERFLGWKLPKTFNPDGGIKFDPVYANGTIEGGRHEPIGTNLFDYTQAKAMVEYMLEGLPDARTDKADDPKAELQIALDRFRERTGETVIAYTHDTAETVAKSRKPVVVFTGHFEQFTRSAARSAAKNAGWDVHGSVDPFTDLLVAGPGAGSKLAKAQELGIRVIGEQEWIDLVNGKRDLRNMTELRLPELSAEQEAEFRAFFDRGWLHGKLYATTRNQTPARVQELLEYSDVLIERARSAEEALFLFREFTIRNARVWELGAAHHHPIWGHVAEVLHPNYHATQISTGPRWQYVQATNKRSIEELWHAHGRPPEPTDAPVGLDFPDDEDASELRW